MVYPARALRALGLLLADGALTVGWGKTFCRLNKSPHKNGFYFETKSQFEGAKTTAKLRATRGSGLHIKTH